MSAARRIKRCPDCQAYVFDTPLAAEYHARKCKKSPVPAIEMPPTLTIVPEPVAPAKEVQPEQSKEEKTMSTDTIAPEKNGTNGKSHGIGKWVTALDLSETYGYHPSFFTIRAQKGLIRRKGQGKASRYSSADAKAVAATAKKQPHSKSSTDVIAEMDETVAKMVASAKSDPLKRIRYLVMGVELGVHSKAEAFDKIAALVGE